MTTSGGFEFIERFEDFVDKLIRDNPDLARWRDQLLGFSSVSSSRDDDLEEYLARANYSPSIGVRRTNVQGLNTATATKITFETEEFRSTDLFVWDGAGTITVQEDGIITVLGNIRYATNSTGWRSAFIYQDGLEVSGAEQVAYGVGQPRLPISDAFPVIANDTIELYGYQTSGGVLNVDAARLRVIWLGGSG